MLHWREPSRLRPFEELGEGPVDQRRVFGVRSDRVRSQHSGKELTIDRLLAPDWVNVVAFGEDERGPHLLCVRQYRFGSRAMSLEIPAGLVDPGEVHRDAALRELLEETGHAPEDAGAVRKLGVSHPNAAVQTNTMSSYFVPRAAKVAELDLDEHEEIEVVKVPVAEIDEVARAGLFTNAAVLVALYYWRLLETRGELGSP